MTRRPGMRWRVTSRRRIAAYDQPRPATIAPHSPKKWSTPAKSATGITVVSSSFGNAWRANVRRRGISKVDDIRALLGTGDQEVERERTECDLRPSQGACDDPPMRVRAVVLDFFGTLARATAS